MPMNNNGISLTLTAAKKGGFKDTRSDELLLEMFRVSYPYPIYSGSLRINPRGMQQSIAYSKVNPSLVGDICVGTVITPGPAYEARAAALAAGYPEYVSDGSSTSGAPLTERLRSVPVQTINRFCSSGLMAVTTIGNQIRAGQIEVGLAVGVESMSQQ